jgi:hypothetical protein
MTIVYRTDGAWGSGKGSNLAPAEVDGNFHDVDTRVAFIEDNPVEPIAPIAINIEGSAFTMGLSNGDTLGPIAITYPMPTWRGNWAPSIAYNEMDFFIAPDGGLGAVMIPHTSAATFDWAAIDSGSGLPVYRKLIGGSGSTLALDGLTDVTLTSVSNGQLLAYDATAGYWKNATIGSGTGTVTSVATGAGLTGGPVTTTGTIALASVPTARVLANISGASEAPSANTMTAILDAVFGAVRGSFLYRGSGGWASLTPGTDGNVLTTHGTSADPAWAPAAGGGASISISDTPPGSPTAGALWWDSVGGQLYLFYNDGSSSQWVPSSNQPGPTGATGATGPAGPSGPWTVGSIPFATTTSALGQDNANLFFDDTNNRLGIGTTAPSDRLDVGGNIKIGATANDGVIGFGSGGAATTQGIYIGRNLDSTSGLSIGGYGGTFFHAVDTWNAPGAVKAIIDNTNTRNLSGAWAVISGLETKQDVAPYTRGLDALLNLNPVEFRYRAGTPFAGPDEPSKPLFGLIADDVRPHVPEIVGQTTMTVAGKEDVPVDCLEPGNLIYALLNAVKTLKGEIDELRAQLAPQARH